MEREYDVVVIGTGVAGSDVAWHCGDAGMRVAITDRREYGGTCALRGCVPKKVLAGAAEVVARVHDQQGNGVRGTVSIDWPALIAFVRTFTDPTPRRKEESLREAGVDTYHESARFVGPNRVMIGDDTLTARQIVIAAGAHPRPLGVPGADLVTSSDDFFYLETLPDRIVFIGGGYISFELAHVAARAGSSTTILQRSGRVLKGFDPDIVDRLVLASREIGIDVQVNMPLVSVERTTAGLLVRAGKKGEESTFEADMVVHGAGRVSTTEGLGLAAGNVATDRRGIAVDDLSFYPIKGSAPYQRTHIGCSDTPQGREAIERIDQALHDIPVEQVQKSYAAWLDPVMREHYLRDNPNFFQEVPTP